MAERNQLKVADEVDAAADDPFAELTRIMGFDPRRPEAESAPRSAGTLPVEPAAEDDFGIDLEKELMGEFRSDDGDVTAEARADDMVAAEPDFDAAIAAGTAEDLHDYGEQPAAWYSPAPAYAAYETGGAPVDFDLAPEDLAQEMAAQDGVGTGIEEEALHLDADELAREFAQALEEGDGEYDYAALEPGATDLTDGMAPSAPQPPEDEFAEDFRHVDLTAEAAADLSVQPAATGGVHGEDLVALELDPAELDGELVQTDAALAPEGDVGDAGEFEAVPSEPAEEWNRPAAWQHADDGLEDELSGTDLAGRGFSEDQSDDPAAVSGASVEAQVVSDEDPTGQADPSLQSFEDAVSDEQDEAEPVETAVVAEQSAESGNNPDHDDYSHTHGYDIPNQGFVMETSFEAGSDEFTEAVTADEAELDAGEYQSAQTDSPDDGWLNAADASGAVIDESDSRVAEERLFEAGEAGAPDQPHAFERPDEIAPAFGEDSLPSAAPAAGSAETEFSLEDELNALLGNIKAVGRTSAAAPWQPEVRSQVEAATAASLHEDLPDFDDALLERALAGGLEVAGDQIGDRDDPAADGLSGDGPLEALDSAAVDPAGNSPVSWGRANPGPVSNTADGTEPARAGQSDEIDFTGTTSDAPPEIETIEVTDRPVALADDLDIPELDYHEAVPPAAAYDDLDAEFASLLNDMNMGEPAKPQPAEQPAVAHAAQFYGGFDDAADAAPSEAPLPRTSYDDDTGRFDFDVDNLPGSLPMEADFGADEFYSETAAAAVGTAAPQRQRRGLLFAGIVGAVALAGGVGAFALSFGGSGSDMPALVKADNSPVKVKPENPGGTTVPNQDSAVYETVVGAAPAGEPQQEKLVTTAEEPLDVSPPVRDDSEEMPDFAATGDDMAAEDEMAPAEEMTTQAQPKGEDRIEQILQESEEVEANAAVTAVAPRKVRTMIVRPDGTLVPREEPAVSTEEPAIVQDLADAAAEATREAATPVEDEVGPMAAAVPGETAAVPLAGGDASAASDTPAGGLALPAEADAAVDAPAASADTTRTAAAEANAASDAAMALPDAAADPAGTETAEAAPSGVSPVMPDIAPIAPPRPAEQPIDVVGEVKADRVAAVATSASPVAAQAAAGSGAAWSVQIASQPNETAARSTYQDLAGRYGSVLAGREVSIVKAEIAGKGTFWRVRVPADSRNEAIRLCESYKEAGGNCFVSR